MKKIVSDGHGAGNHTYSHKRLVFKSMNFIEDEIEKTNEIIRGMGYQGEITSRPPNCKKLFGLPWYLWRHDIKTMTWDIEPDTYFAGDADKIVDDVLNNVKPGSIILLHPFCDNICQADREALPKIIDGLKAKDFEFVTINELLAEQSL